MIARPACPADPGDRQLPCRRPRWSGSKGLPPRARVSTRGGPVHPIDPNGEIMVGQMYVQYVRLAAPRSPVPLLMWHGGGMTGVNWETTPDGRPAGRCSSCARASTPMSRMPSSAAAPPGRRIPRSTRRRRISAPPRKPGRRPSGSARPVPGIPIRRCGARIPACAFPLRRSTPSSANACRAGAATTH